MAMMDDRESAGSAESVFRASNIGSCVRALVAERLGYERARDLATQEMLDNAAAQGTAFEPLILEEMANKGWIITDQQREVALPGTPITGHIDGIAEGPTKHPEKALLEVKTFSHNRFATLGDRDGVLMGKLPDQHMWQISVYMHALNLPCVYVAFDRSIENIELGISVRRFSEPPYSLDEIRARVETVEKYVSEGQLPDCTVKGGDAWFCAFRYLHDADETKIIPAHEVPEDLVVEYEAVSDEISELTSRKNELRDAIKAAMREPGRAYVANYTVSWSEYTDTRLDGKRIKAEMGAEWVEKYSTASARERLTVKRNDEE